MDTSTPVAPTDGWPDFVQRLAHGVRREVLAHPQAFPLLVSGPCDVAWLRPPLGGGDWAEAFLSGLLECGFSDDAAVASYRAFTGSLLGHLLLEASTLAGPAEALCDADDERLRRHPTVARLRSALSEDHGVVDFEEALELLLDRMACLRVELAVGAGPDAA